MAKHRLDLARDVLDKLLVDAEGNDLARVDGVIIEIRKDKPPRVDHLELGFVVLAARFHPRAEALAMKLHERWSVRRSARYSIPWKKVDEVTDQHIKVDVIADDTPAFDWERWLRKHIVHHLPGGKPE
jgi:hypothetical protein